MRALLTMKTRFFTAFILTVFSASLIFGQTTHTPPTPARRIANRVARLTTLLTLSTAQQAEATTIFTTEQTSLTGFATGMKTARTALKTAVQANNAGNITTQANQIGTLTTQEVEAHATADAAFYAILSSVQQIKYTQLSARGGLEFGGWREGR
jgi:Spy/CpxP family protein refolding chaperone